MNSSISLAVAASGHHQWYLLEFQRPKNQAASGTADSAISTASGTTDSAISTASGILPAVLLAVAGVIYYRKKPYFLIVNYFSYCQ